MKCWGKEEASLLLYEGGWESQYRALVVVGQWDVLRSEGEAYAGKLEGVGVMVDLKIMRGMLHSFFRHGRCVEAGEGDDQCYG